VSSLLNEKLILLPFGTAALKELLDLGLLEAGAIYRRREIVDILKDRFIELGGDRRTTAQQVLVPLKRALRGAEFEQVRPGFYRYVRPSSGDPTGRTNGHSVAPPTPTRHAEIDPPAPFAARTANAAWSGDLAKASTTEAITAVLRVHGREAVADRLVYLDNLTRRDPSERPIAVGSLRQMAQFLLQEQQLPDPEVAASPGGFAQVEWMLPDTSFDQAGNGLLVMEFLHSVIRFAALSAPYRHGANRLTVHGSLPHSAALAAVSTFTAGIARQ